MRRIFWGFCRNLFLIDPLQYLSSRSDFGFEFAELFVTPDSPYSASWGDADLPTRILKILKENSVSERVGETATQ
jgi:hypothetical protein